MTTLRVETRVGYRLAVLCTAPGLQSAQFVPFFHSECIMSIERIHTYLVHPNKLSKGQGDISGTNVDLSDRLFDLLDDIYAGAEKECDIDITFSHADDGSQSNDCRNLITDYVGDTTLEKGKRIAERLGRSTDNRSKLGLLFLITGTEGTERKIVISRFPTDVAIQVNEDQTDLTVEFLERVFMKNKASYKAVVYRHASLAAGIWTGRATDRQVESTHGRSI